MLSAVLAVSLLLLGSAPDTVQPAPGRSSKVAPDARTADPPSRAPGKAAAGQLGPSPTPARAAAAPDSVAGKKDKPEGVERLLEPAWVRVPLQVLLLLFLLVLAVCLSLALAGWAALAFEVARISRAQHLHHRASLIEEKPMRLRMLQGKAGPVELLGELGRNAEADREQDTQLDAVRGAIEGLERRLDKQSQSIETLFGAVEALTQPGANNATESG